MIVLNICLSDIPEKDRRKADNGKYYANIVVDQRREVDQYGNTHTVYMSQSKEQRQARENKSYIGSGKEYVFQNQQQPQSNATPVNSEDDLPF